MTYESPDPRANDQPTPGSGQWQGPDYPTVGPPASAYPPGYGYPPAPGYGAPPGYPPPPAYGPPPYGYYAPPRPTNGFAIASMVLGILWLYWVGSILALIFGLIARRQIRERGESGDGMAIAGIVLGIIGVAVLVIVLIAVVAVSSSN